MELIKINEHGYDRPLLIAPLKKRFFHTLFVLLHGSSMIRPPNVRKASTQHRCTRTLQYLSVYISWCSCIVFLVVCGIPVTSNVSAFLFDSSVRLPVHQQQQLSFQLYFVPNNSIRSLDQNEVRSFILTKANTQKYKRITTYAATTKSIQQQQQQLSVFTLRNDNFNSANVDSLLSKNRTIAETTWHLLNGTEIGSWDRTDFEMMEYIVETLCATSSSSSHTQQPQQKQRVLQQQQQQYKRAAFIVERFLHRIIQEQRMENPFADCVDMTALYTNLIHAWSNSYEMGSPERAEEILDYFQSIYEEGDSYDPLLCGPTIDSFNAVIGAYAQSGRSDAPQQSIRVLTKLYELNKVGRTMASPNQQSFART
jgi:hypothetical protein